MLQNYGEIAKEILDKLKNDNHIEYGVVMIDEKSLLDIIVNACHEVKMKNGG